MKTANRLHFIFFILFTVFTDPSFGNENKIIDTLVEKDKQISESFDKKMDQLDLYLADERQTYEKNRSTVILRVIGDDSERAPGTVTPYLDFDLHFPQLEEKWQIYFSNYDRLENERQSFRSPSGRYQPARSNFTGLSFLKRLGHFDVEFQPQFNFSTKLGTRYLINLSQGIDFLKIHRVELMIHLFGDSDKGVGEIVQPTYFYRFTPIWTYFFSLQEEYFDFNNTFLLSTNTGFEQTLGVRKTVEYVHSVHLSNRPQFHLDGYSFHVAWKHEPLRRVFRYSLSPYIEFEKIYGFKGNVGLTLTTEFIF